MFALEDAVGESDLATRLRYFYDILPKNPKQWIREHFVAGRHGFALRQKLIEQTQKRMHNICGFDVTHSSGMVPYIIVGDTKVCHRVAYQVKNGFFTSNVTGMQDTTGDSEFLLVMIHDGEI